MKIVSTLFGCLCVILVWTWYVSSLDRSDIYKRGCDKGLVEGKQLIPPSMDAKEVIHMGALEPSIKPSPDVMPWTNRIKQLKHMQNGDSSFIHSSDFSMNDDGVCQICVDALYNPDPDFKIMRINGPIAARVVMTKYGYEVYLKKNDKFKSLDDQHAYIRILTERWRIVQKIHFYDDGKEPWKD